MKESECYLYFEDENNRNYEFVSEGPKGRIWKRARFAKIDNGIFNFSFGDYNHKNREINDLVTTNNGDLQKILNTLVNILLEFTGKEPLSYIFISGSTGSRTRLYQININKNIEIARKTFRIWGRINEEFEVFEKNKNYNAFLLKRK